MVVEKVPGKVSRRDSQDLHLCARETWGSAPERISFPSAIPTQDIVKHSNALSWKVNEKLYPLETKHIFNGILVAVLRSYSPFPKEWPFTPTLQLSVHGFKESFHLDGVETISIDRITVNPGITELNPNLSSTWPHYKTSTSTIRLWNTWIRKRWKKWRHCYPYYLILL